MIHDIVPPTLAAHRYHLRQWFASLDNRGGVYGDKAMLLVVNWQLPELSYITWATL